MCARSRADDRVARSERDLAVVTQFLEEKLHFQASVDHRQHEENEREEEEEDPSVEIEESGGPETRQSRAVSSSSGTQKRKSGRTSIGTVFQHFATSLATTPSAYIFTESVWSAAAWVGLTSSCDSFFLSFVCVLNVLIQAYFTLLISLNLGRLSDMALSDSDLEGFMFWRFTSAHHVRNYDEITGTSLATRVCGTWPAITASYDQLQQVQAFSSYVGDASLFDILLGGPGLAMLCVMCWVSWVSVDVLDNLDFSIALLSNTRQEFGDC